MMQRYTPKLHPSGHVDMVLDDDGEFVRFEEAQPQHWDEPDKPRWERDQTLLRAKEGEE